MYDSCFGMHDLCRDTRCKCETHIRDIRQLQLYHTDKRVDEIIRDWKFLTAEMIVKYSNGLVMNPVTEETTEGGYPDWWYDYTGYQYGPRIYQLEELRETEGLNYTGEYVYVPGDSKFEEIIELL